MGKVPLILFLDIDGVLNNAVDACEFSPYNMVNLKILVNILQAKIVLTSDRRRNASDIARTRSELLHIGIEIFDTTPIISYSMRHDEIRSWLNQETWESALILDDLDRQFVDPVMNNVFFFQTDSRLGLTESNIDEILTNFP